MRSLVLADGGLHAIARSQREGDVRRILAVCQTREEVFKGELALVEEGGLTSFKFASSPRLAPRLMNYRSDLQRHLTSDIFEFKWYFKVLPHLLL